MKQNKRLHPGKRFTNKIIEREVYMVMTQDNTKIWAGQSKTAQFMDWDKIHDGFAREIPTWRSPKTAVRVMNANKAGSKVARRWERRHRSDMEDWKVIKVRETIEFIEDAGEEYYSYAVIDDEDDGTGDVFYNFDDENTEGALKL